MKRKESGGGEGIWRIRLTNLAEGMTLWPVSLVPRWWSPRQPLVMPDPRVNLVSLREKEMGW